jgi:hypothetical protein
MRSRRRQQDGEREGRGGGRRSVYEDRPAPEPEEEWRPIGEIDPVTGHSTVDLEKARRWRPIEELWRRR